MKDIQGTIVALGPCGEPAPPEDDALAAASDVWHFARVLDSEVARHLRYGLPLSLALIRIDDSAGDTVPGGQSRDERVLTAVAAFVASVIRQSDVAGRVADDAFAVLLPVTGKEDASFAAERLRVEVERQTFPAGPSGAPAQLTVSIGLATLPADAASGEELLRAAGLALDQAHPPRRNCVTFHGGSRRSFQRTECTVPATVHVASPAGLPVDVASLSPGGLGFSSSVPLEEGTVLEIRLALPGAEAPLRVVGRVASHRSVEGNHHHIGVRFEGISSADRRRLLLYLGRGMVSD